MSVDYQTIVLNSSNLDQNGYSNKYSMNFLSGFNNSQGNVSIAVSSVSLYFSWFNISSALGNNRIDLIYPTAGAPTTIQITIPDGYYSVQTLNEYLQSVMISNNVYMTDASGNNVYYLEVITNPTYYSIDFNFYLVPSSVPSGYTSHFSSGLPAVATTPQITIYDNFSTYCGISAGTYPAITTATTTNASTTTPQVDKVQSLILCCDCIDNKLADRPSLLYSFPVNSSFGGLLKAEPHQYMFMKLRPGNLTRISFEFFDQDYNKILMRDNNIL